LIKTSSKKKSKNLNLFGFIIKTYSNINNRDLFGMEEGNVEKSRKELGKKEEDRNEERGKGEEGRERDNGVRNVERRKRGRERTKEGKRNEIFTNLY
jgi:hypothetical protein